MKVADEARLGELDTACEAVVAMAGVAEELFAVVDVLDVSAGLRRAFTDPASSPEARSALGARVFSSKVSADAMRVVDAALAMRWRNGSVLADAVERQAVRLVLRVALDQGTLDEVIASLHDVAMAVRNHNGLREALRDGSFELAHRQGLLASLVQQKVSEPTLVLLKRAIAARSRTFALTLEGYLQLASALRTRQIAHVVVARPLSVEQQARLKAALVAQTERDVDLQIEIDERVIGGVRVQLGDDRIDSTVAGRLDDVQRQLTT